MRFSNWFIVPFLVFAVLLGCAAYSVYDRYCWVKAPDTLLAGWCNSDLGPRAGIHCSGDGGFDYRITKTRHALYRTPGWAFWPFYQQGESPELPKVLLSLNALSEKQAATLRSLAQPN